MNNMSIAYQLQNVFQRISDAVTQYICKPYPVTLLAVSKTHKICKIEEAFNAGQRNFGENYLQEAVGKIIALNDYEICWHYIGPIQSNKTSKIAEHFDWVHSVERLKIARRLSEQRSQDSKPLNICLQVNISAEENKSGVAPDQLRELMTQVQSLERIKLRGLMCIPAKTDDFDQQRLAFREMSQLFHHLQKDFPNLDTLSMGMSGDLEAAIAEGSTMVRVGTDIFGTRNKPLES
ncbi:MAG: YggS family pyridoxal phosphate-dependent enzyme [Gammaproteobacteria bacterium]|nr:YggS family pyridoxal phosphate-dependent enzyme [Gammaproteobacteria bacterium]